jgi:iron(III) transport system substrate-binding protein
VFWSADLDTAMALQAAGRFAPLPDGDYGRPPSMVDPDHRWVASSAVARVIIYDPDRVHESDVPAKVLDLIRPEVARQLVLADPARGNAAWHAAALFAALGEPARARPYRDRCSRAARRWCAMRCGGAPCPAGSGDPRDRLDRQRPRLRGGRSQPKRW